ncbi:hypothetical protein WP12_21800 [Sphingomonas sp. SRS2]|nr:hypothetical protein WP12_21800 [Sphingomonas sp. SRS2]
MPHLARVALPDPEVASACRIQEALDDLARYARTFTAAGEMLSFAHQRAGAHEAQFKGDASALAAERRNLLIEWQHIAVREGAMTLLHIVETMSRIGASLAECPTLSVSTDHSKLLAANKRFRLAFPGFRPMTPDADDPTLSASEKPGQISFSQSYSAELLQFHSSRNNVFRFGQNMKYIAKAPGSDNDASYTLDSKAVYELRGIATTYAEIFADAVEKLGPKSPA